ncbi:hypothetical protein [Burkholderia sp. A9]|uniref:hypothetical protein n=1 Tax=Burkholderia sp. A9 TaxID=1365108 RepID=UPI001269CE24|nr:hypothetical protein [Burkholderia sp. A9]
MKPNPIDSLRLSYRSMLDARNLSPDQLKDLAATLFVTCYATIIKCEESIADRAVPASEITDHARELSASLTQGHVLPSLEYLAELPDRFASARVAGIKATKSESGRTAVGARDKKILAVRKYALDLANASKARTKTGVLNEILEPVMAHFLSSTGRPMTSRGRATVSNWLLEDGFVELSKRPDTSTR